MKHTISVALRAAQTTISTSTIPQSTTQSSTTSSATTTRSPIAVSASLSGSAVGGIVAGGVIGLAAIVVLICLVLRCRKVEKREYDARKAEPTDLTSLVPETFPQVPGWTRQRQIAELPGDYPLPRSHNPTPITPDRIVGIDKNDYLRNSPPQSYNERPGLVATPAFLPVDINVVRCLNETIKTPTTTIKTPVRTFKPSDVEYGPNPVIYAHMCDPTRSPTSLPLYSRSPYLEPPEGIVESTSILRRGYDHEEIERNSKFVENPEQPCFGDPSTDLLVLTGLMPADSSSIVEYLSNMPTDALEAMDYTPGPESNASVSTTCPSPRLSPGDMDSSPDSRSTPNSSSHNSTPGTAITNLTTPSSTPLDASGVSYSCTECTLKFRTSGQRK
ncbi:uncharacterized protein BDR25DRAFT_318256 [Lindgomyces ingoldianus]|uniref:Uncharacterized protein n=1 Tax=Lindgomyces ingoldianus TaxID=673940 RepID=A0ACB6QFK4_9PLEO|nr:uncharacterized protein BDR25DRAFT_318256 [Lindgomyces ingoldianus]KAF2465809.1 hypothetical protein BDR25DRAFT_318256 [Lindgomyces ingoldianus]